MPADASCICDKAAVLGDTIKETQCRIRASTTIIIIIE
jgi:hypothetical protein